MKSQDEMTESRIFENWGKKTELTVGFLETTDKSQSWSSASYVYMKLSYFAVDTTGSQKKIKII